MQDLLELVQASNANLRRILTEMGLGDAPFGTKDEARATFRKLDQNHAEYDTAAELLREFE